MVADASEAVRAPAAELSHPKYRRDIDGLRAVAILPVVAFHAFPKGLAGGFIGVDVFFVISGYLISMIIFENLESGSFSFTAFYVRRIRRIFPALALVLGSSLVFGWFALLPGEYRSLGKHAAAGAGFVSNLALWAESGYFDTAAETKPFLHLWSLGIEEQFYVFWPLILWVSAKRQFNVLAITLAALALSFGFCLWQVNHDPVSAFYLPQSRVWELLIGSVLAYAAHRKMDVASAAPGRDTQSMAGFLLIICGALVVNKTRAFPGVWALLPVAGSALLILAGPGARVNRTILSSRLMVWTGLISFPLYLWHWPLLSFLHIMKGTEPTAAERSLAVCLAFALAWATYRVVERPLRFGGKSALKAALLCGTVAMLGLAGGAVYEHDGFLSRFPVIVRELVSYRYDGAAAFRSGTCFLSPEQDFSAFAACQDGKHPTKKTLLLWGDSHAAGLAEGFHAAYGGSYNVVQRTASSCPPILNLDVPGRPFCRSINDQVFASIAAIKPDKIVLSANWLFTDWRELKKTVSALGGRRASITVIGTLPQWTGDLPKQLYSVFEKTGRVPVRMTSGLNPQFLSADPEIEAFVTELGVSYASPRKIMCNEGGCLTRLGDTLAAFDYGHPTAAAAVFIVKAFAPGG